jgi:hypothetical protein
VISTAFTLLIVPSIYLLLAADRRPRRAEAAAGEVAEPTPLPA